MVGSRSGLRGYRWLLPSLAGLLLRVLIFIAFSRALSAHLVRFSLFVRRLVVVVLHVTKKAREAKPTRPVTAEIASVCLRDLIASPCLCVCCAGCMTFLLVSVHFMVSCISNFASACCECQFSHLCA